MPLYIAARPIPKATNLRVNSVENNKVELRWNKPDSLDFDRTWYHFWDSHSQRIDLHYLELNTNYSNIYSLFDRRYYNASESITVPIRNCSSYRFTVKAEFMEGISSETSILYDNNDGKGGMHYSILFSISSNK